MRKIILLTIICGCFFSKLLAQITILPSSPTIVCGNSVELHATSACLANQMAMPDDMYSDTLPIGFNFNFYGTIYSKFLISSNGYISFNLANALGLSDWKILNGIFNNGRLANSIAGVYTDIDMLNGGIINWAVRGSAPNRKLVVNFCDCALFLCHSQKTTFQIMLYETSDIAEVHILNRGVCAAWNSGAGIEGVENAPRTAGTAAPGRNYPAAWTVSTPDAYRFTPNSPHTAYAVSSIPYSPEPMCTMTWFQGGAIVGFGPSITVHPKVTTAYDVRTTGCDGTTASATVTVNVTPNPPPPGTIAGPAVVCGNQTSTYTSSGTPGGVWTSSSTTLAPINSFTGVVTFGNVTAPTIITIKYRVTDTCGTDFTTMNVLINPTPAFTVTVPPWVCSGSPVSASATIVSGCTGGCTYSWDNGATGLSTVYSPVVTSSYVNRSGSFTVSNAYGCSKTVAFSYEVVPIPNAGTISCPLNFCANDMLPHACTVAGNTDPGVWSMLGGGTDVSIDAASGSLSVNPALSSPLTVFVTHTVTNRCGTDLAFCRFTVYPAPVFAIAGPDSVCSGEPIELAVLFSPPYAPLGETYLWNTGATTAAASDIRYATVGMSYFYSVTVTNTWGCSATETTGVTVNPLPDAGVINCPPDFCSNAVVSYICTVEGSNGAGTWSSTGGGTDAYVDALGNVIVNPALSSPTTVTVYYTVTNSCGTAVASCSFTVYPPPAFTITGPTSVCSGAPIELSVLFTPPSTPFGATYSWSTGATTAAMSDIYYTALGMSHLYNVTVTNAWGCSTTKSTSVIVNPSPDAGVVTCPPNICSDAVDPYKCTVAGNNGIGMWSCTGGGTDAYIDGWGDVIVNPALTSPVTVTVYFTVTNSCGTAISTCNFTVSPPPVFTVTGPASVCSGDPIGLAVSYTPPSTPLGNTYLWSTGDTTSTASDTRYTTSGMSYLYNVTVTNAWGCSVTNTFGVTVNPLPDAGVITCPPDFCSNGMAAYICKVTGNSGVGTWYSSGGGTDAYVDPFGNIVVNPALTSPATVTVYYTVTNSCGTAVTSCSFTVYPPPAPVSGPQTVCQGDAITLSTPSTCGYWLSSDNAIATVDAAGVVTGISGGIVAIDYVCPFMGGCMSSMSVFVIPRAHACVRVDYDPHCDCWSYDITGTPGATAIFQIYNCHHEPIGKPVTIDRLSNNPINVMSTTINSDTCYVCIKSIEYLGCSWPCEESEECKCCAERPLNRPAALSPGVMHHAAGGTMISVVPNPNKGVITLKGSVPQNVSSKDVTIEVTDMLGRAVYWSGAAIEGGTINKAIILGDNLVNGVYTITVKNAEINKTIRIILDR